MTPSPVDTPRKRFYDLSDAQLYCITTPPAEGQTYQAQVEAALQGGADMVQLRDKSMGARGLIALCRDLQALCDKTGALFILNDRVDVALAADVDGVHVGQEDLTVHDARRVLGHRKLIGASSHSLPQALQAQADGADYVSCGPVYATPTKPDYGPVGLDLVKQYRKVLRVPFVAIGGIDASNVEDVIKAGADRVAVVRAVSAAPDPSAAARELKEKMAKALQGRPVR
jgi:thiamine-phosphate pyrophosphorylase